MRPYLEHATLREKSPEFDASKGFSVELSLAVLNGSDWGAHSGVRQLAHFQAGHGLGAIWSSRGRI